MLLSLQEVRALNQINFWVGWVDFWSN